MQTSPQESLRVFSESSELDKFSGEKNHQETLAAPACGSGLGIDSLRNASVGAEGAGPSGFAVQEVTAKRDVTLGQALCWVVQGASQLGTAARGSGKASEARRMEIHPGGWGFPPG